MPRGSNTKKGKQGFQPTTKGRSSIPSVSSAPQNGGQLLHEAVKESEISDSIVFLKTEPIGNSGDMRLVGAEYQGYSVEFGSPSSDVTCPHGQVVDIINHRDYSLRSDEPQKMIQANDIREWVEGNKEDLVSYCESAHG